MNKLITLGTPHRGIPSSYKAWYGGDPSDIFLNSSAEQLLVGALYVCTISKTLTLSSPSVPTITNGIVNHPITYSNFITQNIPSTENFLPVADVNPPYLADLTTGVAYPHGLPPNQFLQDLQSQTGQFDITKLDISQNTNAPSIVSIYGEDPIQVPGIYNVISPPSTPIWKYGEVVSTRSPISGDTLVPSYSANIKNVSALSITNNITGQLIMNINHIELAFRADAVRQILADIVGVNIGIDKNIWNAPPATPNQAEQYRALSTCSPIRTLVTDALGRRAGLDLQNGQIINEIPGAIVAQDGDDPHVILLPSQSGAYHIETRGKAAGAYTLGVLYTLTGTNQIAMTAFMGETSLDQTRQFEFELLAFQETTGLVVAEAEHYTWNIEGKDRIWVEDNSLSGYSGNGYLSSTPDIGFQNSGSIGPKLQYTINFSDTGDYYIWLRGYAPNASGDSIFVGLDAQSASVVTGFPPGQWGWSNQNSVGQPVKVPIATPGIYTLQIEQREDGLRLDRILLTTDSEYNPNGLGPNESQRISLD